MSLCNIQREEYSGTLLASNIIDTACRVNPHEKRQIGNGIGNIYTLNKHFKNHTKYFSRSIMNFHQNFHAHIHFQTLGKSNWIVEDVIPLSTIRNGEQKIECVLKMFLIDQKIAFRMWCRDNNVFYSLINYNL